MNRTTVLQKWTKYLAECGLLCPEMHANALLNILVFELESRIYAEELSEACEGKVREVPFGNA